MSLITVDCINILQVSSQSNVNFLRCSNIHYSVNVSNITTIVWSSSRLYCAMCTSLVTVRVQCSALARTHACSQRRNRGWPGWPKSALIPSKKKIIRQKQLILFATFTLHIKLHSVLQCRRNVLWFYYISTDLTP